MKLALLPPHLDNEIGASCALLDMGRPDQGTPANGKDFLPLISSRLSAIVGSQVITEVGAKPSHEWRNQMSGTNFNYLVALREAYPATTSSCHNMFMLAAALQRKKRGSSWNDINDPSRAYAAFHRALNETINSIRQETGEAHLICNLTFLAEYLVRFTQACPNWSEAYDEISKKMEALRKKDALRSV